MKILFPLPTDPVEATVLSNDILTRITKMARKGQVHLDLKHEVRDGVRYITAQTPDQMYIALCLSWPEGHWLVEYMDSDVSSPERDSPEPQ